jgi:hypothetical protein
MKKILILLGVFAFAVNAMTSETNRMSQLVANIVAHATAGDAAFFAPLMDEHYRGRET